jgi:hypothetical protein
MLTIKLNDGKYTYIRDDHGNQKALRYGEMWRDLTGDNLIGALAARIEDLELELAESKLNVAMLMNCDDTDAHCQCLKCTSDPVKVEVASNCTCVGFYQPTSCPVHGGKRR